MPARPRQRFAFGPFRGMRAAWRGPADEALAYEVGNMLPANRLLGASPLVQIPPSVVLTGLTSAPAESDNFSASNLLDAVGETTEATLAPGAALNNEYTIHYAVTVNTLCPVSGSQQAGITVAVESNDDPGGVGVWTERYTETYLVTAVAGAGACAAQYSRPNADITAFNATPGGADYDQMDEVSPDDDTTYAAIFVDEDGGPATYTAEVKLSTVTDPQTGSGHYVKVRYKVSYSTGAFGSVEVRLVEDDGGTPRTRASWFLANPTSWTTYTYNLTTGEANSIVDYSKLSIQVEAIAELDSSFTMRFTWIEFGVPSGVAEGTTWAHEQPLLTVAGLGASDKFRLKVKSTTNGTLLSSFSVHGFDGSGDPAAGVTYLSGAAIEVQGFGTLMTSAGEKSYACAGGELYQLNYATAAWTRLVTSANLGTKSITLASTGEVYFTTFNNGGTPVLVISDGVNTPFHWDGATFGGGTGVVKMTNAPVFYGQPTVYYAKLFAIKSAERDTIVWCEENAPATGYEAGGYNNAWTLSQTGGATLQCLVGTNQALYYFRETSIGSIRGPVDTDFTASGVHDDVSTLVGTTSPRGAALLGTTIWVQDAEGRPWAFSPGGEPEPLWEQVVDYWGRIQGDPAQYSPGTKLVYPGAWVGLDADGLVACCWKGSASNAGGILFFDGRSRQVLCVYTPAYGDDYLVVGPGFAETTGPRRQPTLHIGWGDGSSTSWPPFYMAGSQYGTATPTRIQSPAWVRFHAGFGQDLVYCWDRASMLVYLGEGAGTEANIVVTPYWADANALSLPTAPATFKFFRVAGLTAGTGQTVPQVQGERRSRRLVWGLERESRHLLATFADLPGLEAVTFEAGVMRADPART